MGGGKAASFRSEIAQGGTKKTFGGKKQEGVGKY